MAQIIETDYRSRPPKVILGNGVLKISNKFTEAPPYRSVISIKLLCNLCASESGTKE